MKIPLLIVSTISLAWLGACSDGSKFKGAAASAQYSGDDSAQTTTTNEGKGGNNSTTTDGVKGGGDNNTTNEEVLKSLPKFGMLVNHFECGFCHMKLLGDMASTDTVPAARNDSISNVEGDWLVRGQLNINDKGAKIDVAGEKKEDYAGTDVPKQFPVIDFASAQTKAKGSLSGVDAKGAAVTIAKSIKGNVTVFGTAAAPIKLSGDVFVDGDLIINGEYSGVGTIYASGSIYLPADLKAQKSVFPYPAVRNEAIAKAVVSVNAKDKDALGLAAGKSIFIGGLDRLTMNQFKEIDPENHRLDFQNMYTWFGAAEYKKLHRYDLGCEATNANPTLNVVDGFLYARQGISGLVSESSFSIRGGMIAEAFNLVNGVRTCLSKTDSNAVHGHPKNASYIEYDWRLYTGKLPILERLGEVMQQK